MEDVMWAHEHRASIKAVEGSKLYLESFLGAFGERPPAVGQRFEVYKLIWLARDSFGMPLTYRAVKVGSVTITEKHQEFILGTYTGQTITKGTLLENGSEYMVFVPDEPSGARH